ncbi:hypothetical protein CBR_g34749 [Chara braunii]|uniref:Reverse transcriptase domain-containing protein n=1 Tax=Chara braunii TaxID=69332 RepID=A0A388LJ68_CHABU|nr:hypothetical protein CBR_g34749 [Chara braunii]|eukprot:GBG82374.1 hypothetical protein CBR_g34749 [Chara braunii]
MTEAGDLCPSHWRAPETKASTSYDVNRGRSASPRKAAAAATVAPEDLRRQIEELNKSLASVSEFVLAEKAKKAEEEHLRIEAEEEAERMKVEQKAREKKEQKRIKKQMREAQRATKIDKKVEFQLAIKTGDFFNRMEASLGPVLEFAWKVKPVKQKVHIPSDPGNESYESGTEDIRAKTKKLTIHEKRKRGPDVVFEDIPPIARILKAILVGILRNLRKISEVYRWGLKSLIKLYNVIKDFSKKSTRKYLRRLISRVVHDSFGFSLSADLVIRVKFDDRIRLVELRKLMNDGIMACKLLVCIQNRAMKKVQIVWVKNPSIGHTLHNQQAFASRDTATCVCAGSPHPKEDGHVCFRLCDGDTRYQRLSNANDISHPDILNRMSLLRQKVVSGFSNWYNLKGFVPDFSRFDFQVCFGEKDDSCDRISVEEVNTVKRECDGLVLTPLDRNAGETLVMCPFVYYRAMMDSFVTNVGYRTVKDQEREVLAMVKMEVREEGLAKFARWDDKGSYGVSYVLAKHKDTSRFRPICPTFKELMVKTRRVEAKALNHLLFQLPVDSHFNLQAVSSLAARLQRINRRIERGNREGVESASYDIKEMFNRLPHEDTLEAVEWIVDHYRRKGKLSVRVNTRGRGASFGKTTSADHWRQLDLFDILKFVRLELKHTYTYATGVLLRQVIGIPMGKSTSPPLACILCAYAECKFLNNLGVFRKRVFGIRLVDDVTLVTIGLSAQQRGAILDTFESCYPQNLVLKRTDTGSGTPPFLGCEIRTQNVPPHLGCVQLIKNEQTIWDLEKLTFKNGQSYTSWGSKQQKVAIIGSYLHRIDQNTTIRSEIPMRVLTVKRELRIKGFPKETFERVLKAFTVGRDAIWKWTVKLLFS